MDFIKVNRKNPDTAKKTRRAAMAEARKKQARQEAEERQEKRNQLSAKQQLAKLDMCFGPGLGAKRERARLARMVEETKKAA